MKNNIVLVSVLSNCVIASILFLGFILKKRFSNIYRDTECLLASQPTHGQLLGYILAGDVRNAREAITRILEEP